MFTRRTFVLELLGYVAFTVVMAGSVAFFVKSNEPGSNGRAAKRPSSDAKRLESFLGLPAGTKAVVEFMDFQCPPCRASWPVVRAAIARHPEYRYFAVNFPLPMHPFAFPSAVASEIAKSFGVGNRVFDDLFSGRTQLDTPSLNAFLKRNKLPPVLGDSKADPYKVTVKTQIQFGKTLRIAGTPTILVLSRDGSLVEVPSANLLEKYLN